MAGSLLSQLFETNGGYMRYIEGIEDLDLEAALDSQNAEKEEIKFNLRQVGDYTAIEVVLLQVPSLLGNQTWVEFRQAQATAGGTSFSGLGNIYEPDELIVIAKMALLAWEQMLRLNANNDNLEQAG
jgi:hypothetical protein